MEKYKRPTDNKNNDEPTGWEYIEVQPDNSIEQGEEAKNYTINSVDRFSESTIYGVNYQDKNFDVVVMYDGEVNVYEGKDLNPTETDLPLEEFVYLGQDPESQKGKYHYLDYNGNVYNEPVPSIRLR